MPETDCDQCGGVGSYRNASGLLIPCPTCRGAGVLDEGSAYRHLDEPLSHPLFDGICGACAGTGCSACGNRGRRFRTFAREIGHLCRLQPDLCQSQPERKPVTKEETIAAPERREEKAG